MNKRFLTSAAAAVVALVAATPAFATQSRMNSLCGGCGGGVKQFTVLDDRNIFDLPAELVKYGTWTAIEIDGPGYTSFGIHYNFTPTVVMAVYGTSQVLPPLTLNGGVFAQQNAADGNNAQPGGFDVFGLQTGVAPNFTHKGHILLAFDLGSARLGIKLGVWGDKHGDTAAGDTTEKPNKGPLVINIGLGAGFSIGSSDLDLGLDFKYGMATNASDGKDLTSTNQFSIGLVGRATVPFSGPHEAVPFFRFDIARASSQNVETPDSPVFSALNFNMKLGCDIRLNLGEGITVQPGIGIAYGVLSTNNHPSDGNDTSQTFHDVVIPFYNVAVDVKVFDWLDIRFGGGQEVHFWVQNNKDPNGNGGQKDGDSKSDREVKHKISTGVGFNLPAGVSIDVDVSTGWWKQGPYLITGNAGTFGLSAAISKDW